MLGLLKIAIARFWYDAFRIVTRTNRENGIAIASLFVVPIKCKYGVIVGGLSVSDTKTSDDNLKKEYMTMSVQHTPVLLISIPSKRIFQTFCSRTHNVLSIRVASYIGTRMLCFSVCDSHVRSIRTTPSLVYLCIYPEYRSSMIRLYWIV